MTSRDIAKAAAGLAVVMARDPSAHRELVDAFLLLTESLADIAAPPKSMKQSRVERLAQIERSLAGRSAAERMSAVMDELGIRRSYYYEARAAAISQGLLELGNSS